MTPASAGKASRAQGPRPTRTVVLEVRPVNAHRAPVQDRGTPPPRCPQGLKYLTPPSTLTPSQGERQGQVEATWDAEHPSLERLNAILRNHSND